MKKFLTWLTDFENCNPVDEITLFDGKDYQPDSCTPLYDAIGSGISLLRRQVTDDDQVLMTIITDGLENDSHEFDYKAITSLMDKMKSRGWIDSSIDMKTKIFTH